MKAVPSTCCTANCRPNSCCRRIPKQFSAVAAIRPSTTTRERRATAGPRCRTSTDEAASASPRPRSLPADDERSLFVVRSSSDDDGPMPTAVLRVRFASSVARRAVDVLESSGVRAVLADVLVAGERGVPAADRLCAACLPLLGVDAAAVSVIDEGESRGTFGASDAARLLTAGEVAELVTSRCLRMEV
jgi:hypothetical protein